MRLTCTAGCTTGIWLQEHAQAACSSEAGVGPNTLRLPMIGPIAIDIEVLFLIRTTISLTAATRPWTLLNQPRLSRGSETRPA